MLGVRGAKRPDRADEALAELMRELRIDRGPSSVPKRGVPYLSPEGFPYRVFDAAHPELVEKANGLTVAQAVDVLVKPLRGLPRRKIASLLKLCVREDEMPLGD
jgi:hypothetical protein